jgi:hypothetical protein
VGLPRPEAKDELQVRDVKFPMGKKVQVEGKVNTKAMSFCQLVKYILR